MGLMWVSGVGSDVPFFFFLWVSVHGGGGCVVAVDMPWWWRIFL